MLRKQKRGAIELQFNWIFVLIVGGMILLLFYNVIGKQKDISEVKMNSKIKTDLGAILVGAKVSSSTASLIDIPKVDIEFDEEGYRIKGFQPIKPLLSFSPGLIRGNYMFAWALEWNVPYRAANFLYFTSPEVRYIIVDDDASGRSLAEEFNETLPEKYIMQNKEQKILLNKELVSSVDNINDANNYKVRLVFFNTPLSFPTNLQNMEDDDLTAIYIHDINGGIDGYGTIDFYKKSDSSFVYVDGTYTTYYLGRASLVAAMFADNIDVYNYNMRSAFKELEIVSTVYLDKTKAIEEYYLDSGDSVCNIQAGISKEPIGKIKDNANSLSESFPPSNIDDIKNLYDNAEDLKKKNNQAKLLSCALVY